VSAHQRIARVLLLACALLMHRSRAPMHRRLDKIALDAAAQSGQPLEYKLRAMAMVHVRCSRRSISSREDTSPISSPGRPSRSTACRTRRGGRCGLPRAGRGLSLPETGFRGDAENSVHAFRAARPRRTVSPRNQHRGRNLRPRGLGPAGTGAMVVRERQPVAAKGPLAPQGPARTRDDDDANASIYADTSPLSWNSMTSESIATGGLSPIARARIYALVSMVIADAYTGRPQDAGYSCGIVRSAPAAAMVLEAELGARLAPVSAPAQGQGRAGHGTKRSLSSLHCAIASCPFQPCRRKRTQCMNGP